MADTPAEGEKKIKKPRPPPPAPPAPLATAALLVRGAAAKVLGLRPGPSGGELQPIWVTEPGCSKVNIGLDGCTREGLAKDEVHIPLLDAIEVATNELVKANATISVFEVDRATAESKYGDAIYDTKSARPDMVRLAYVPGALLVEVPPNVTLCATAGACGAVTFLSKTVEEGSKKKPDTIILAKKKQMSIRYQVANPDASAVEPTGEQPSSEAAKELDVGTVRVTVAGVDTKAAEFDPPARSSGDAAEEEAEEGEAVVNPWEVSGKIDYTKLTRDFGSTLINDDLIERLKKVTVGRGNVPKLHHWLTKGIFFSHRDLEHILACCENNKPFYLYTGRGPSSAAMHLGHLIPFLFTKWLQDAFNVPLVIQMTDDEKFLWKGKWDVEEGDNLMHYRHLTTENAKDIIACGFDKKKTFIFSDLDYVGHMYPNIVRIWKAITYNQARSAFGFQGDSNIGQSGFPAIQAAPSFPSSFPVPLGGDDKMGCLIPCAIDQDPYFRITRDIAHKLVPKDHPLKGKPALIHSKFFPPLQGASGKMSASDSNSAVYLTDTPEQIESKITKFAFSGGQALAKDQREKGANLDVDVSYQWLKFFLDDEAELEKIGKEYGSGQGEYWNTGSVKKRLINLLQELVKEHKERRAKITDEEVAEWMAVRKLDF